MIKKAAPLFVRRPAQANVVSKTMNDIAYCDLQTLLARLVLMTNKLEEVLKTVFVNPGATSSGNQS